MKALAIAVSLVVVMFAAQAQAIVGIQPEVRGGYYFDAEAFALGVGADIHLTALHVVPNIEWAFADNADLITFNADAYFTFVVPVIKPYAGGGLAWIYTNPDGFDSQNDFGVNLIGGLSLTAPLNPFAQLKYIIADNNEWVLMIGARF